MSDSFLDPTIAELLVRKWTGQALTDDLHAIERWQRDEPDHAAVTARLRNIWNSTAPEPRAMRSSLVRERVWATIQRTSEAGTFVPGSVDSVGFGDGIRRPVSASNVQAQSFKGRRARWTVVAAVAACAAALVGLGSLGIFETGDQSTQWTTYTTRSGERAKITLSDGSTIALNSASTVRYAREFGRDSREVYIEGEAIFTVARSEGSPFVVHAKTTSARVLGTVFAVRRYETDSVARVVVAEGRVGVGSHVLVAGDAATIGGSTGVAVQHSVNIATAFAWSTGRLVFSETTLRNAIPDLQRRYGITIRVTDPKLLDRQFSTTLEDEVPKQVLQLLAVMVHAHVAWDGSVVTLSPEAGPAWEI